MQLFDLSSARKSIQWIQQLASICRHYWRNIIRACKPRNRHVLCLVAILIAIQIANPVLAASLDYGDAPNNLTAIDAALTNIYPSASHQIGNATYLGMSVDADPNNQPSINADGDDTNGTTPNDEDGVIFPIVGSTRILTSGASNSLTIKASKAGILNAWIDWNQDGIWNDTDEKIATNLNLNSGNNTLMVTVPLTAPHGVTYSRFRFSSTQGLGSTGATTNDGEVEDYKVNIALPQITACDIGLLNGGFEQPNIPLTGSGTPPWLQDFQNNRIVSYKENDVPAWGTIANVPTSSSSFDYRNAIELWKGSQTAISTTKPFEGNQFAEINANTLGRLYQDFVLPAGAVIRWQVAHRGRAGNDTMGVYLGSANNELIQSTNTTPNTEWRVYSGVYTVPGGQDITRFALKAISSAGGEGSGNFVDDIRLTAKCPADVKGYKSVKLTTDINTNGIINPGDTLTYSLYYTNTGTGPTAGFQINDRLPAGVNITATGATTVTIIQNASATKNSSYTGAVAGAVSNLLNPGALLDVNGIIRVDIPVTVNNNTVTGTLANQGFASSNDFTTPVLTDNIDSKTTGLGLTIPTGSIPQQQNSSIEPTTIRVVNVLTKANILFVKRITAIGNNNTKNPNDNTVLNTFVDDSTSNDNNLYWPSNYLIGAIDAGKVKSGDSIEYTVYFLNAGLRGAKSVMICDLITANQSFQNGSYGGVGKDIQIQIGTNTVQPLTAVNDTLDRTQLYPPDATISNCNLKESNLNRAVVAIGATGAANTGIPALTVIPGSTAAGTPNDSYGLVRFKTIVQ
jgi:uncharacterized repeat protein (TIGR01451 family)